MTNAWTNDELDRIGTADELALSAQRADGTLRRPVPVWVVRVGDELYVRSWHGTGGAWHRTASAKGAAHIRAGGIDADVTFTRAAANAEDAIDAAYRTKYARYPSYVEPMVSARARASTLKLERA